MIAYHFRVMEKGVPNGWVGFAFGDSLHQLFDQIDFYVDPYSVEIKKASSGSAFQRQDKPDEFTYDCEDTNADVCCFDCDDGWKKPKWVTDPNFKL